MPDSEGNIKGILVPELPWLKDEPEEFLAEQRSALTRQKFLNPTSFDPDDITNFVSGYRYVVDEDGTEQVSTKVAKEGQHHPTSEA